MKLLPTKRMKELTAEKNRLEADLDDLQVETARLRLCIAGVESMATMAKQLGHQVDPDHLLFLIRRDLEE